MDNTTVIRRFIPTGILLAKLYNVPHDTLLMAIECALADDFSDLHELGFQKKKIAKTRIRSKEIGLPSALLKTLSEELLKNEE